MIAAMTNQPVGTVTKQLSRAVDRLRTWWNKEN
jgi:DNA-directed RNA polymerase specialized sigma24 family protein